MMRRTLAVLAAFSLAAVVAAPIHAQDILGMSLRPAPGSTDLAGTGSIDILRGEKAGTYTVKVDLSKAAESLDLSKFEGAKAFVVWAVDLDGQRHRLGKLDDKQALGDTAVDYGVAKVYVTAEADAEASSPSAPLYALTLRQVKEQESAPAAADNKAAASAATSGSASTTAGSSPTVEAKKDAKPSTLPTTGSAKPDLLVMGLLALLFIGLGLKLSGGRV
mgnify:CR=1 FL=1